LSFSSPAFSGRAFSVAPEGNAREGEKGGEAGRDGDLLLRRGEGEGGRKGVEGKGN